MIRGARAGASRDRRPSPMPPQHTSPPCVAADGGGVAVWMVDLASNPMAELLETVEIDSAPAPRASVIWMHGLGADGHDFAPIVPELSLSGAPPIRFVFPHAPMRPVTINAGMVMRAWYDVASEGGMRREDEEGVRAS